MAVTRFVVPIVAAATAIAAAIVIAQSKSGQDRVDGWRGDIEYLVAEAQRVHAGPGRPAHSPVFAQAAAELSRRIPDLPDHRIAVEIQRLVAMLGDGHSLVYPMPSPRMPFATLPLDLYLFDDGLFVVDGSRLAEDLIGSRVVRFGGRPAEDVLRDMAPYVSRDNDMALKAFAGLYLVVPAFLEACGAADSADRAASRTATGRTAIPRTGVRGSCRTFPWHSRHATGSRTRTRCWMRCCAGSSAPGSRSAARARP
jgi:hypothetical protein